MPLDLNSDDYAGSGEYEVIPAESVVVMRVELERDKENPDPRTNLFYRSGNPNSNVIFMKWKFTVVGGEYADKWFRNNQTVEGGTLNDKGQSKSAIRTGRLARQITESHRGIRSDASDQNSAAARILQNDWPDLHGMVFLGKVGVEAAKDGFPAKNKMMMGIPPDSKHHYDWRSGQGAPAAAPDPNGPVGPGASVGGQPAPAAAPSGGGLMGGAGLPPAQTAAPAGSGEERPNWAPPTGQ